MRQITITFDSASPMTEAEFQSVYVLAHKGVLDECHMTRARLVELREQHGLADDEMAFVAAQAVRNGQQN